MIQLIDLEVNIDEDVQFGTCDLCMYVSDHVSKEMIFKDTTNGKTKNIQCGYWSWGDYIEVYDEIDNIVDFAVFLDKKNIQTFDELDEKLDNYYWEYANDKGLKYD